MKTLFNDNWLFAKTAADACVASDAEYTSIQLPHDWLIYDTSALYETSFGHYKKLYSFHEVAAKSIRLYFEGVYMDCTIYVNGTPAFDWKYGYSSFEADITDFVREGENEIAVLVRHRSPNSRWYSGAGIFRDVYLIETPKSYLNTDGVYFHTEKVGNNYDISLSAEVTKPAGLSVSFALTSAAETLYSTELPAAENTQVSFTLSDVPACYIWDIQSPNLLTLTTTLKKGSEILDCITERVGLREIKYTPDEGFFLNSRHVKLNGVCLHHDLGCLGAAFHKSAARRQLALMQEMGANAVRTSHNMPAKAFMELCDEMGILVDSEAFDMWERPKTEFDYARFFDDWYEKDVASWIRRDRNHASVIMWSVGNEIYDTHVSPRGCEVSKLLHDAVRAHDPLGNAPTTIGSNYMPWEGAQNCAMQVDLAGYNYGERLYNEHHAAHPEWCIYGSETTSGVKSRGIYHFPREAAFLTHDDLQCSALGNCRSGASAETAQQVIAANRDFDLCAGMFIWTGADYLGEPSPYSTKNAYFGNIDTAGLKKDSFYLYRAAWTDQPVLHLFPYWDFNEGQLIDVVAYTNLAQVELFVNGVSAGVRTPEEYTVSWNVPYTAGEIRAVGTAADGTVYEAFRHSFGDSAAIVLTTETDTIPADGESIVAVTVSTVDADGYPVDNARDRISLKVTGGRLIGFDNGDSTDYDSYKCNARRLFSGKAVAYIAAPINAGTITVTADSNGLTPATICITATPAAARPGISTAESIDTSYHSPEVPLRKIALSRSTGALLTPENASSVITAVLAPANTDYQTLTWSIVTNSGIETNLATLSIQGQSATVTAVGDGSFRLRCSSNNGRPQPEIISELEFTTEGFGQASINPYEFLPACLHTDSLSLMDEVRSGGVAIQAHNNIVGFAKTDFGKYGSDRFLVRIINWHKNDAFCFRLWLGHPQKADSVCLGNFTYQADFEWQTYKDNHYILPQPICGMQDLYFEFDKNDLRIDFGGFVFEPKQKAYEQIAAADNDMLHGDTYKIENGGVHRIGNNVFLDFDDMDFCHGTSQITITGKTYHDNDSIHVHFVTEAGLVAEEIVEFPYSENTISVTHPLPDIHGRGTVKFRFLPGCDFDFESFQIKGKAEIDKITGTH